MNKYPIEGEKPVNKSKHVLKIIRITLFLLLFGILLSQAAGSYYKGTELKLQFKSTSIKEICEEIEKKSNFRFIYAGNAKKIINKKIDLAVNSQDINEVLDIIISDTDLKYRILDNQVVLYRDETKIIPKEIDEVASELIIQQQKKQITGKIIDENGDPIIGANIVEKSTTNGTVTDVDGNFSLTVENDVVLHISYIGYLAQDINTAGKTSFNIVLQEDTQALEEVVVIGYGVQKKATVTGAISSVGSDDLIQAPVSNVSKALVGRVSGLIANQYDSEPGKEAATLRIRGRGTFSGSANPLVLVDGIESSNFNNIDFNEIQDVTVLKDASATAVYGVRGANGVIIITTKRGSESKPVIGISSNVGMLTFTDLRKNLRSYDYAVYYNEARKMDSFVSGVYNPRFTDEAIEHFRLGDEPIMFPDTDWFSVMMKPTSMQTQQNINIRGGTSLVKYFVSGGYFSQEGLFNSFPTLDIGFNPNINFRRFNIRGNFDFNISDAFSVNVDLSSIMTNKSGAKDGSDGGTRNIIGMTFYAPPFSSPGVVDGKIVDTHKAYTPNPIYDYLNSGYYKSFGNDLAISVGFNYKLDFITEGLRLHGKFSHWNMMTNQKRYSRSIQTYQATRINDNSIIYVPQSTVNPFSFWEGSDKSRDNNLEVGLNYDKSIGYHTFGGLLLYHQKKLYDPHLAYVIPNGYQDLVSRITYNYRMRYMAEFNVGYTGTENFAIGKRFGLFPAFSLSWVPSEESFYPKNDIVSYIKIRGSYGEVGKDNIGGNRFLYIPSSYIYSSGAVYYGAPARSGGFYFGEYGSTFQNYESSYENTLGNPNLTWERAKKTNIGVDLVTLNDKVKLTLDYFDERRDNILTTPQTTPQIVGITLPVVNWGKVKNSGYEGEITYNDNINNFNYWLKGNYSYAHNVILFQDEVNREYPHMMRTGHSIDQPFGYIAEGFYNTWEEVNLPNRPAMQSQNNYVMPGDTRYKDINGDGIIDQKDQVPIGYPTFPEITYGISLGGSFKGIDFSILFQGATNYSRMYVASNSHIRPYDNGLSTLAFIPEYSWSQEKYLNGEDIKLPRLTADMSQFNNYNGSTFLLADASYLRLKNAEIGYTFDSNLLKRIGISNCRIYINGNNLYTWMGLFPGIDPEQGLIGGDGSYYPMTRTFNTGINLQF